MLRRTPDHKLKQQPAPAIAAAACAAATADSAPGRPYDKSKFKVESQKGLAAHRPPYPSHTGYLCYISIQTLKTP